MSIRLSHYSSAGSSGSESVYQLWERGIAFKDSITPATHITHYQSHIYNYITTLTEKNQSVLSLGCGNGFIEGELVKNDYTVNAIDISQDAVNLSIKKGINASIKNYYDLTNRDVDYISCVYADGFIGHLYNSDTQLNSFFDHLEKIFEGKGVTLVLSNDAPIDGSKTVQIHEKVPDFWYISIEFLTQALSERGYTNIDAHYYLYDRPISGTRRRTIVSAKCNKAAYVS